MRKYTLYKEIIPVYWLWDAETGRRVKVNGPIPTVGHALCDAGAEPSTLPTPPTAYAAA